MIGRAREGRRWTQRASDVCARDVDGTVSHNNIEAINKIKELNPIAFYNAWAMPLNAKINAQQTLAHPNRNPRAAEWRDKKNEATEVLASTKKTIVDIVNEEHVTKATMLAFFTKASSLEDKDDDEDKKPSKKQKK